MTTSDEKYKKMPSEILHVVNASLFEMIKTDEEAVRFAIHKRNNIIATLRADKEHMLIAFKEISQRYDAVWDALEELKKESRGDIGQIVKLKEEVERLNNLIINNNKNYQNLKNEYIKVKTERDQLKELFDNMEKDLENTKTHLALQLNEQKSTVWYKLNKVFDKLPDGFIKHIIKFLFSKNIISMTLFFIFCIVFSASLVGWDTLFNLVKIFF